ncbi:MAG: hypothetical protein GY811_01515 [Myxococcales bacterium]|nr:hypothetical protein [Myxococcales bacterium]
MVGSTRLLTLAALSAVSVSLGTMVFGPGAFGTKVAHADSNDLVLSRLGTINGTSNGTSVVGSNINFRSLASELGVVMAPRLSEPSDTLGFGGFHFSADVAFTSISNNAAYWNALEEPNDGTMTTTGLFVKKGMWIPLPSFEVGIGAVHLGSSHLWASQGYVKFALHEGYHEFPLPSVAVRGAVSRMMGSEQLDLTVASVDMSMSKDFGIAGLFTASPYVGLNWIIIVPRSEVIDKTPNIDSRDEPTDANMNFVFSDQDGIVRNRIIFGTKLKYYIFTLTLEANFALAGSSVDDKGGTSMRCVDVASGTPTADCDATDTAGAQSTFTTSLGLDF